MQDQHTFEAAQFQSLPEADERLEGLPYARMHDVEALRGLAVGRVSDLLVVVTSCAHRVDPRSAVTSTFLRGTSGTVDRDEALNAEPDLTRMR